MSFNEKLQKLRKEKKYSQEELADLLDVTRQSVSKWESGQTYPEMDKLLSLCKIFNCSLEELTNDEIKINDFGGEKKSNFNSLVDSVLDLINKVYHYFSMITFKEFVKCFIVMTIVWFFLVLMKNPVTNLEYSIYEMFGSLGKPAVASFFYHLFSLIFDTAYYVLFVLLFVYVFKIGFLDKKIIKNIKDEELNEEAKDNNKIVVDNEPKIGAQKHNNYTFFNTLGTIVMFFVKFALALFALPFVVCLIFLCCTLALDVYLIIKGLFYLSVLIGVIFAIIIDGLLLELIFNIIFNKKHQYKRMLITFLVGIAGIGISSGIFAIEISNIKFINDVPENIETTKTSYSIKFNKNYYIEDSYLINKADVNNYIVDNSLKDEIVIELEYYPKYNNVTVNTYENSNSIMISNIQNDFSLKDVTDLIIKDLKENQVHDYYLLEDVRITLKSSEANINALKANEEKYYNQIEASDNETDYYNSQIGSLESKTNELQTRIDELENENQSLKDKIQEYKNKISSLLE